MNFLSAFNTKLCVVSYLLGLFVIDAKFCDDHKSLVNGYKSVKSVVVDNELFTNWSILVSDSTFFNVLLDVGVK